MSQLTVTVLQTVYWHLRFVLVTLIVKVEAVTRPESKPIELELLELPAK